MIKHFSFHSSSFFVGHWFERSLTFKDVRSLRVSQSLQDFCIYVFFVLHETRITVYISCLLLVIGLYVIFVIGKTFLPAFLSFYIRLRSLWINIYFYGCLFFLCLPYFVDMQLYVLFIIGMHFITLFFS